MGEASGQSIRLVGQAPVGNGSGWGEAVQERRGLTTRATFKACTAAGQGEWKATACRSVQPWQGGRGLIRKCCSLPEALGQSPVPTGQSCPCGRRPGCHPPSAVSGSSQWATSAGSAFPLSPGRPAASTGSVPSHSPVPWADWRKGNKTKQNKDLARFQTSMLFDTELPRKQAQVRFPLLSPQGAREKGWLCALCPCPAPSLFLVTTGLPELGPVGTERQDLRPRAGEEEAWCWC